MDLTHNCTRPTAQFIMVPSRLIADRTLSPTAKLVLIYAAGQPAGFVIRRRTIMEALGIGRHQWDRTARELRDRSLLTQTRERNASGNRFAGSTLTLTWDAYLDGPQKGATNARTPAPKKSQEVGFSGSRETRPDMPGNPTRHARKSDPLYRRDRKNAREGATDETLAYLAWTKKNPGEPYSAWLQHRAKTGDE